MRLHLIVITIEGQTNRNCRKVFLGVMKISIYNIVLDNIKIFFKPCINFKYFLVTGL